MTDPTQFLDALQDGDKHAWEQFYTSHLLPLRSKLARSFHSLSPEEIDDVWAMVIERAFQKIGTVRVPKALGSWLWQVARSQALTYLERKERRRQSPIFEEIPANDLAEQFVEALNDETSAQLRDAFEALSPVHRSLLMMRAEGVPDEVIYHFTGLGPPQQRGVLGHVRSRIGRTS
jgi:RNA polymerase sigma factor (sigma-70 family)